MTYWRGCPQTHGCTLANFSIILDKPILDDFSGGNLTGDSGALFLRQMHQRPMLSERLAACLADRCDAAKVHHPVLEQFRQRVYRIATGYEDCSDADTLRADPALKTAAELDRCRS